MDEPGVPEYVARQIRETPKRVRSFITALTRELAPLDFFVEGFPAELVIPWPNVEINAAGVDASHDVADLVRPGVEGYESVDSHAMIVDVLGSLRAAGVEVALYGAGSLLMTEKDFDYSTWPPIPLRFPLPEGTRERALVLHYNPAPHLKDRSVKRYHVVVSHNLGIDHEWVSLSGRLPTRLSGAMRRYAEEHRRESTLPLEDCLVYEGATSLN